MSVRGCMHGGEVVWWSAVEWHAMIAAVLSYGSWSWIVSRQYSPSGGIIKPFRIYAVACSAPAYDNWERTG
jgi:hypothetical protein